MKYFRRILAAALMLSLVFVMCACTPPQKVIDEVYKYLNDKYPNSEFVMGSVEQDTVTSGKYIISVYCKTTDIDFDIYASTLIVTDGYGAKYANDVIFDQVKEVFGEEYEDSRIVDFQWIDIYEEGFSGYRFREMSNTEEYNISDVDSVYRIKLAKMTSAREAVLTMQNVLMTLAEEGAVFEEVTFEFVLEGDMILFTTNTYSLATTDVALLEESILSAEAEFKETTLLFTQHEEPKTVAYFVEVEDIAEDSVPEVTTTDAQ